MIRGYFQICAVVLIALISTNCYGQTLQNMGNSGAVSLKKITQSGGTIIYKVQSNNYPARFFSQTDIDDYGYRVNKRNCSDSDILVTLRTKGNFRYDFYGSDDVKAGSFYTTHDICKQHHGAR